MHILNPCKEFGLSKILPLSPVPLLQCKQLLTGFSKGSCCLVEPLATPTDIGSLAISFQTHKHTAEDISASESSFHWGTYQKQVFYTEDILFGC